jgi:hypothetical protein
MPGIFDFAMYRKIQLFVNFGTGILLFYPEAENLRSPNGLSFRL